MAETREIFDPFEGKTVQIKNELVDRLRGKYATGPTLPSGQPEFGYRIFQTPPVQHEAADEIEKLRRRVVVLEDIIKENVDVGEVDELAAMIVEDIQNRP